MAGRNERAADCSDWLEDQVNKTTRETALYIENELVRKAAVDKGTLRASFIASVGRSSNAVINTTDTSGAATLNAAIGVIGTAKSIKYPTIYIQNNQPYAYRIMETGHSKVTPPKTLSLTIQSAVNI
jgi:hypothetical protein